MMLTPHLHTALNELQARLHTRDEPLMEINVTSKSAFFFLIHPGITISLITWRDWYNMYSMVADMDGCCKEGAFMRASELLQEMRDRGVLPNVVTYSSIIHGISPLGEWNRAMGVFHDMVSQGISPNVVTFNAYKDSLCKQRLTCEAEKLVGFMEEREVKPDVITYTTLLLQGFVLEGRLDEASVLFARMVLKGIKPNQHSYSILINGYCKNDRIREALHLAEKMMKQGLKPNDVTSDILLNALSNHENQDEMKKIISEMRDGRKYVDEN